MLRLLLVAIFVVVSIASCGGGNGKASPAKSTPSTPAIEVARQYAGEDVHEIEPGVYARADGLLVGPCETVKPYVQKHGKPHGMLCY